MNKPKTMTARALRDALNAIPNDSPGLDLPVVWWGEDRGGFVAAVESLSEDHYNPSGEGCEAVSDLRRGYEYEVEREGETRTFEEWLDETGGGVAARAGQVVVHVDWTEDAVLTGGGEGSND